MAWDFSTEPEFQEQLDWMREFVREEIWPIETVSEDLSQAELDLPEAPAAELGIQVRGPQPTRLDLLLERAVDAIELLLVEILDDRLDRPDLLADELAHPCELLFELGLGREIPCHCGASGASSVSPDLRRLAAASRPR